MSESLPMPTRGPVDGHKSYTRYGEIITRDFLNRVANVCHPGMGPTEETTANIDLIAAAFNAAEEARKMGYDPIAAVQAVPKMMKALTQVTSTADESFQREELAVWSDAIGDISHVCDAALAAARTRDTTT